MKAKPSEGKKVRERRPEFEDITVENLDPSLRGSMMSDLLDAAEDRAQDAMQRYTEGPDNE